MATDPADFIWFFTESVLPSQPETISFCPFIIVDQVAT